MAWRASLLPGVLALSGCLHHAKRTAVPSPDQSFYNVKANDRLRVVVPLVKDGGSLPHYGGQAAQGTTITLSANDLVGFETAHYETVARRGGRIQLRFMSAEQTKDGKTIALNTAPRLPFRLPSSPLHLRLVYFIRQSSADHNMAILGARQVERLQQFTAQLQADATVCGKAADVFCEWVPQGIAVRPES